MKNLGKFPIEVFGVDYEDKTGSLQLAIKQQYCKYIKDTCVKPRKSEPEIKVGICSLGSTVCASKEYSPVIVCPQRFKVDCLFETLREKYLSKWSNVKWVKEVNIGVGGCVDYVAVELGKDNRIRDFLCVEFQAGGTTGTPYPAVTDLRKYGKYKTQSYKYGINWANEFSKTMMQQAYKKGRIIEHWGRKIVFVVQDVAMKYIMSVSDCSKLVDCDPTLPVDFCSFKMFWENSAWNLKFDAIRSTSIDGIRTILGGAKVDEYPTEEDFIENIIKKGKSDGIFPDSTYV